MRAERSLGPAHMQVCDQTFRIKLELVLFVCPPRFLQLVMRLPLGPLIFPVGGESDKPLDRRPNEVVATMEMYVNDVSARFGNATQSIAVSDTMRTMLTANPAFLKCS